MYCVGVEELGKRVFLLMVDSRSAGGEPLKMIRLLLDQQSSALVSPFYKHFLQYTLMNENEEGKYVLCDWTGSEFRIKKKDSESNFASAVRDIVRNSFFPLMVKTSIIKDWQRESFCWDTFHRGLASRYHPDFSLTEWTDLEKLGKGKKDYWKSFRDTYKDLLDPVIKSLEVNKNTVVENNLSHLFGLLDLWKTQPHITGYFRHRLLEVGKIQTLFKSGFTKIFPVPTHTYGEIHDLCQLQVWLESLGGDVLESFAPKFQDQKRLLLTTLSGKISHILKHFLLHKASLEQYTRKQVRGLLVERLLVPVIKSALEQNASLSKSTLQPVTRKSLLYYYGKMFSTRVDPLPEEMDVEEEKSPRSEEYRGNLLDFLPSDGAEILAYCLEGFEKICQEDSRWESFLLKRNVLLLKNKPDVSAIEEGIRELWCEKMEPSEYRLCSVEMNVEEWQNAFMTLDDVDRGLYQIRFSLVPLSLSDLREGKDLELLMEMTRENIYETILVRPNNSEYTKSRLFREAEKNPEGVSQKDLSRRLHTTQSLTMSTGQVKPLLIILDAHLFPLKELHSLLRFMERRRAHIKRVVFLGALDLLPLDSDGHGFLDLLQWKEPGFIKSKIFQYQQLRKETLAIMDEKKECGEIQYFSQNLIAQDLPLGSVVLLVESSFTATKEADSLRDFLPSRTIKTLTLEDLVRHSESQILVKKSLLLKLGRNQVNHLLLLTTSLIVILDCDMSKKWFLREEPFPNVRYTLPYVKTH